MVALSVGEEYETRNPECGMRNTEVGTQESDYRYNRIVSADVLTALRITVFRIPHSAFRISYSVFLPNGRSAIRDPQSAIRISSPCLTWF
jgi:hypothetical protein